MVAKLAAGQPAVFVMGNSDDWNEELRAGLVAAKGLAIETRAEASTKTIRGRRKARQTGEALIAGMQASPARDIDLTPERAPMIVRDVTV